MGQMQDKIITELRRIAEKDARLEFADQPQYANTGTAYIQRGFDTVAELRYGFFDTYCSITFSGTAVAAAGLPDNPPSWRASQGSVTWHSLAYGDGDRVRAMLDVIRSVLAATTAVGRESRALRGYSARQRRDRAANISARFLPQRDDDESPAIDVAGALVVAHVKNGELRVGVDLETADQAVYRIYGDLQVPLRITVQGDTVFEATGP